MSLNFKIRRYFTIGTQSGQYLKKFYKKANVQRIEDGGHEKHKFGVFLDKRIVRTPMRNKLALPSYELAFCICHEFNMQKDYLMPATMPMLALSRTTVDLDFSSILRENIETSISQFVRNDTVLFREEGKLGVIQNQKLNPVINYINKQMNIKLEPTYALFSRELTDEELLNIKDFVTKQENWKLIAMEQATINCKSTTLGVALINEEITIQQALDYSRLEETFQIEQFGLVEGSHDLDANTTLLNLSTAKLFSYLASL